MSFSKIFFPAICFLLLSVNTLLVSQAKLSNESLTLLKVVAGIHFTFTNCADEIWSGYDLSTQPYIAYLPGEFVLYLMPAMHRRDSNHIPPICLHWALPHSYTKEHIVIWQDNLLSIFRLIQLQPLQWAYRRACFFPLKIPL